jgi:hypothetical protein
VLLLAPIDGEVVDLHRLNRAIELDMGVSILEVLFGSKLVRIGRDSLWAWLGFRVQPVFDALCPTFDRAGFPNHPDDIIQVSHHVQTPDLDAQQSTRFSPWLVFDPLVFNGATGPRLMNQAVWDFNPVLFHLFSDAFVSSGNQLLVAFQHFGNMRTLVETVFRKPLDMEKHWVRPLVRIKCLENDRNFTPNPARLIQAFPPARPYINVATPRGICLPIVMIPSGSAAVIPSGSPSGSIPKGSRILAMVHLFPQEILFTIYKALCAALDPIAPIRHVIPDLWWTSAKQSITFGNATFAVPTPVASLTYPNGAFLPVYQRVVASFVDGLAIGFRDYELVPFHEWDPAALNDVQGFAEVLLPGNLFLVRFQRKPNGFALTLEPNPKVYKIHKLGHHDIRYGCLAASEFF